MQSRSGLCGKMPAHRTKSGSKLLRVGRGAEALLNWDAGARVWRRSARPPGALAVLIHM